VAIHSMITIKNIKSNPLLSNYIRRISVFICKHPFTYRQKLTPSAYTYLSYNHEHIPVSVFGRKKVHPVSRLQIAGPKIHENIYVDYNGRLEQILIEFTASGFYYLFHTSPSLLINTLHGLDQIVTPPVSGPLEENLKRCRTMQGRINLLQRFLLKTSGNAMPPCDHIEETLKLIEDAQGHITVKEIVRRISVSERHLDRRFREIVGVSPKQYANITQLHFVINLMYIKKHSSFHDLALFASYYDLPHFYHRFKELTGFNPVEFINSDSHLALKYYTDLINKR